VGDKEVKDEMCERERVKKNVGWHRYLWVQKL
jgi:hypothetical protein